MTKQRSNLFSILIFKKIVYLSSHGGENLNMLISLFSQEKKNKLKYKRNKKKYLLSPLDKTKQNLTE